MFLRLCVAAFLTTGVQTVLADPASDFEAALAAYQAKLPSGCQIKSPAMKVAYACSKIQSPGANPRFHHKIDAGTEGAPSKSPNGINFCYNSIIEVERNGGRVVVNVTRDVGVTARGQSFVTNLEERHIESGEVVLPIEATKGLCFGYEREIHALCHSFLSLSNQDRPIILVAELRNNKSAPDYILTADSRRIDKSSAKISPQTHLNEVAQGKRLAILYARAQLVAHAKSKMSPGAPNEYPYPAAPGPKTLPYPQVEGKGPTLDTAFSLCDQMLINFENSMNPPLDGDPRDAALLEQYRERIKIPVPNATPTKPSTAKPKAIR